MIRGKGSFLDRPLSRRAVLRGLGGAAVSLPFLEAMRPARAQAGAQSRTRHWSAPRGAQGSFASPRAKARDDPQASRSASIARGAFMNVDSQFSWPLPKTAWRRWPSGAAPSPAAPTSASAKGAKFSGGRPRRVDVQTTRASARAALSHAPATPSTGSETSSPSAASARAITSASVCDSRRLQNEP